MTTEDSRDKTAELAKAPSQALTDKSTSLVRRGLLGVSSGDIARAIEAGKALVSSGFEDQVVSLLKEKVNELRLGPWSLLLMDAEKKELYFSMVSDQEMSYGAKGEEADALRRIRVKPGQGLIGWVAEKREAVVVPELARDARFLAEVDGKTKADACSIVVVPLRFQDRCLGVIEIVDCVGPGGFSQSDLTVLQSLADFAAIGIEKSRHVQAIHEIMITEPCTRLYNGRHLNFILDAEIYRSRRYDFQFSLIFIEISKFNALAGTHDWKSVNELMKDIGAALKRHGRLIDLVFYYPDGEFVMLLPQTSKPDARGVARKIHELFKSTTWLRSRGKGLVITATLSVVSFPDDGSTKLELLHKADEA